MKMDDDRGYPHLWKEVICHGFCCWKANAVESAASISERDFISRREVCSFNACNTHAVAVVHSWNVLSFSVVLAVPNRRA